MTNETKMLPAVEDYSPMLGCDPEFFFKTDKGVIGSEKVLPKEGLKTDGLRQGGFTYGGSVIIDGVQAELNPAPATCRAHLMDGIASCLQALQNSLKDKEGVSMDFGQAIEIPEEHLKELSEKSRKFGCAPSRTVYRNAGIKISEVNPEEYRTRAGAGHLHFGHRDHTNMKAAMTDRAKDTVKLLDAICGNTLVLIDRNEGNIERRKFYGKAGEFRLPEHGLEYRTPSNFWLHSRELASLAFALGRLAVDLSADRNHEEYYHAFGKAVSSKKLKDAINNNDYDLAMENYLRIEKLICDVSRDYHSGRRAITHNNREAFRHFVETTKTNGIEYWFPKTPIESWVGVTDDAHQTGFYDWVANTVKPHVTIKKLNTKKAA